jgi:hypothetical protein
MRVVKNEKTGQNEFQFEAKVVSIGDVVLENSNGTQYQVGTIEFTDAKGRTQRASAIHYTNQLGYLNTEEGGKNTYRAIPSNVEGQMLITATLAGATKATTDMFDLAALAVEADAEMVQN